MSEGQQNEKRGAITFDTTRGANSVAHTLKF